MNERTTETAGITMTNTNESNEQAKCCHWYIRLVNLTTLCDFYQCKFCGKKLEAL